MNKLRENQFFLQSADFQDDTFTVNYTHSNHTSHIRALGRVATILDQVSPEKIKKFKIINTNATVPLYTAEIDRENFLKYKEDNLYKLSAKDIKLSSSNYRQGDHDYTPSASFPVNFFSFAPVVRSQIGGPDGFFFGDIAVQHIK